MAPIASPRPTAVRPEKKSKKEKKRAREEDAAGEGERMHKKSKSLSVAAVDAAPDASDKVEKKKKKSKKDKHRDHEVTGTDEPETVADAPKSEKKKHKKKKHEPEDAPAEAADGEKKKKKKHKKSKDTERTEPEIETAPEPQAVDPDAMDVDTESQPKPSKSCIHQPPDIPANPQFPFFTQTVSLYMPLFPIGWAQPVTSCQAQYLQHLQNKYVPALRGVLLDYRNVGFGDKPGRNGAALDDETPTTVIAKDEAAVGFGWITADVDLFVPSRGAWMEGSINLQTEGHIGVVCFGKFNASVEARRLPPSWKWVPNESPEAQGFEETASVITADDHGVVRQIHSTGFWVDGTGEKIKGRVRFRIRNFDVGTSGETSYLSLEGTMLDRAAEKEVVAEEANTARMRKNKRGGQKGFKRHIPEFSMTRFDVGEEQVQDDEAKKREVLAVDEAREQPATYVAEEDD